MSPPVEQSTPQDQSLRTVLVINAPEDEGYALALYHHLERRLVPYGWHLSDRRDANTVVVLVSVSFLRSDTTREALFSWIASHPNGLRIPLALDDVDPYEASELVQAEVIRSSLGTVEATENPDGVIADLAERVVARLFPEREAAPSTHDPHVSGDGPEPLLRAYSADTEKRVRELTTGFQVHGALMQLVLNAQQLADSGTPPSPLSTTYLLIAIADAGVSSGNSIWSPDWLRMQLGERYESLREDYIGKANSRASAVPVESLRPNHGVRDSLDRAGSIASRTTGHRVIHTRHLIAALLTDPRPPRYSGVLTTLLSAGFNLAELRESFLKATTGYGDDDGVWKELLTGPGEAVRHLGGFHADDPRGTDVLWIGQEVMALATTIAARTVKPPLSIGLFGEWGTGKSFFMREVRRTVEHLSREARDQTKTMQRDLPFYKRIVQIDFNAWHYVEGNLWASLVEHIFDNLKIGEGSRDASDELKGEVLRKLKFEEALREEAAAREQDAEAEVEEARRTATKFLVEYKQKQAELTRLRGTDVLQALSLPEIWQEMQPLLKNVGLQGAGSQARELGDDLRAVRDALARSWAVFLPLLNAPDRGRRWAFLLVSLALVPAAGVGAGWLARWLGMGSGTLVVEQVASLMALLANATTWLRRQVAWLSAQTRKLYRIQRRYESSVATALAAEAARVAAAEAALRLAEVKYVEAQRVTQAAQQRVSAMKLELSDVTTGKLFARFVEDRAASVDYRKHLGVLALVRDDFEKLSSLIDEENWRMDPPDPTTEGRYRPGRFATIEEEREQENTRINRIVLYIDDLDRCPPAKVVEVLQAVHLLLAFPLFVVVVGVDARWVTRSLETHYPGLLSLGDATQPGFRPGAQARDYLEKIFQIPFWIRPMNNDACARMLDELLGTRSKAGGSAQRSTEAEIHHPATSASGSPLDTPLDSSIQSAPTPPARTPTPVDHPSVTAQPDSLAPERQALLRPDLRSLEITEGERRFISALAPLLDRSPRSLKRFVNVYRLLKAGLSVDEADAFTRRARYRMALFLLAVDTAFPEIAATVFAAIENELATTPVPHADRPRGIESLRATLRELEDSSQPRQRSHYERLIAWVARDNTDLSDGFDLLHLAGWVPRIQRYSFHAPPTVGGGVR